MKGKPIDIMTGDATSGKRFGEYLVAAEVLSHDQVEEALRRQAGLHKLGLHVTIGVILEGMGKINHRCAEVVAQIQAKDNGVIAGSTPRFPFDV